MKKPFVFYERKSRAIQHLPRRMFLHRLSLAVIAACDYATLAGAEIFSSQGKQKPDINRKNAALAARVKRIVAEQLGVKVQELDPEARLKEELGADSLDLVELIMALEEAFKIEISDEDAERLCKVKELVSYVQMRVNGQRK